MNVWIIKALFYKILSFFPLGIQNKITFLVRRKFGQLKSPIKAYGLLTTEYLFKIIQEQNIDPKNKIFFELGTGWIPYTSIQLSLMGAKKVYTQDINCLLTNEVVFELLKIILSNVDKGSSPNFDQDKIDKIKKFENIKNFSYEELFKDLNIIYLSKSKSDVINIENNSVDFYYSRSVLEHITKNSLIDIIYEGKRILKNNGLFISKIDLSDHFAKKNNKLSQINFLRFSNFLWEILCKNSPNFTNRLRISDYKREFQSSGMFLVSEDSKVNMECLSDLEKGRFKVHKDFFDYNFEDLATTSSFIIYKKK